MSEWIIVLIIVGAFAAILVVPGLITWLLGGSFWDGVFLISVVVVGTNAAERALGIAPCCPWPGCNYDLQPHRWRHPFSCPACGRPIRWMQEGRVAERVEPKDEQR